MQLEERELPFTLHDYYKGARAWSAEQLALRGGRTTEKVSASALGSCSRKQLATLRGVPATNPSRPDSVITTEQGTIIEEVAIGAIEALGLSVRRGISLPNDYPVSGHPDGELYEATPMGAGLLGGYKWGWEHKHLGAFGFKRAIQSGFDAANPGYMAQIVTYGHALGWDRVLVQVTAQDGSAVRTEQRNAKNDLFKNADPKTAFFGYDLHSYYPFIPHLHQRVQQITSIIAPENIAREYDGKRNFPCNFCHVQDWCNSVGDGGMVVTPSPFGQD